MHPTINEPKRQFIITFPVQTIKLSPLQSKRYQQIFFYGEKVTKAYVFHHTNKEAPDEKNPEKRKKPSHISRRKMKWFILENLTQRKTQQMKKIISKR